MKSKLCGGTFLSTYKSNLIYAVEAQDENNAKISWYKFRILIHTVVHKFIIMSNRIAQSLKHSENITKMFPVVDYTITRKSPNQNISIIFLKRCIDFEILFDIILRG